MLSAKEGITPEVRSPLSAVQIPHATGWAKCCLVSLVALAGAAAGCANTDSNEVTQPVVLGMTNTVTPVYSDQQLTLYQVQVAVPLPVRKPTAQDRMAEGPAVAPYKHGPFLLASDIRLEIHYTISNLDTERHPVYILIDPWNEFDRYHPGVQQVNDEETLPNLSGFQKAFLIDGMQRVEGDLTSDDTTALAIGLATAMNIAVNPPGPMADFDEATLFNHTFDLQNRPLQMDPLVGKYVPTVIAGLTGFDLGLRTDAPENVAIEILIDITDLNGNRLIPPGQSGATIGVPATLLSPAKSKG